MKKNEIEKMSWSFPRPPRCCSLTLGSVKLYPGRRGRFSWLVRKFAIAVVYAHLRRTRVK
jgi:hypothetical protein